MPEAASWTIDQQIFKPNLPAYLQKGLTADAVTLRSLNTIQHLEVNERLFQLLLHREWLTARLAQHGKCYPPLILERAIVYEELCYHDLAAFDAFIVHTLCSKELSDEFVTDLAAHEIDGSIWLSGFEHDSQREHAALDLQAQAASILTRCMTALGNVRHQWQNEIPSDTVQNTSDNTIKPASLLHPESSSMTINHEPKRFGHSRREIYPWSTYEPERTTPQSVKEINEYLAQVSTDVEARVTGLPAFDQHGKATGETSYQLGLFATRNLAPGKCILNEKSLLTAIRPVEAAICDACGRDVVDIPWDKVKQCDGEDCDTTFCSQDCKDRAVKEYHRPALEPEDSSSESAEEQDTPVPAPFCGNDDLTSIGHPTNSTTPEWDLYFLLLTRTIAMSTTQSRHPLSFTEIKFLWGDFQPSPFSFPTAIPSSGTYSQTLPFSIQHNLEYVLDYFTTLSLSDARTTPYSAHWLENFDFWIVQTLFAKFRGVANATQSTFDGDPETASVHPGWCLANHSCAPNVRWTPTGVRQFFVRTHDEDMQPGWDGIKAGEEILSHYTDTRLGKRERQERLMEVLGGMCQCKRCLAEDK